MTSLLVNASRTAARKRPNMRSLRTWAGIHRWTSIISTLFLLILSLTGLPLIFQKEIDEAFGSSGMLAEVPESKGAPTLDSIVSAALARHPGDTMISLEFAKRGRSWRRARRKPRMPDPLGYTARRSTFAPVSSQRCRNGVVP